MYVLAHTTRKLLCLEVRGSLFVGALLSAMALSSRFLVAMGVSGSLVSLKNVFSMTNQALCVQLSCFSAHHVLFYSYMYFLGAA